MAYRCSEIAGIMEKWAPPRLAEDWDNVGLLVGSRTSNINKILVCLDLTPEVLKEAIENKAELIITHHPLIFKGLKRIDTESIIGDMISSLIKNGINLYSAHTNLDVVDKGVNSCLAKALGLIKTKNLKKHTEDRLCKIVVFIPEDSVEKVREAMCRAGAGWIGKYSDCTFTAAGIGTYKPLEGANPYIGSQNKLEQVKEFRLETVIPKSELNKVLEAMIKAHPYEEVAYDVYELENGGIEIGLGLIGELEKPLVFDDFIKHVKAALEVQYVRVIGEVNEVKKVAVFCGSFDNDMTSVLKSGADILVTGDLKYHTAQDIALNGMCAVDAGHFNTEKVVLHSIKEYIEENLTDIEILVSDCEKDPFTYR